MGFGNQDYGTETFTPKNKINTPFDKLLLAPIEQLSNPDYDSQIRRSLMEKNIRAEIVPALDQGALALAGSFIFTAVVPSDALPFSKEYLIGTIGVAALIYIVQSSKKH
jgi:hypothetical protein